MKIVRTLLLIIAATAGSAFAAGPAWDSTGNGLLSGTYYFRQVLYVGASGGSVSQALAFYGNINFNGSGTYSVTSGTALISGNAAESLTPTGTYSLSSSGFGFMSSPLVSLGVTGNVNFLLANGILIGSETETGYNDLFIAAPAVTSLGLSTFSGAYTLSAFFIGGTPATSASARFALNPDGAGHLNTVTIQGTTGTGATVNQSSAGVKYIASNGAFPITFPTSTTAPFYSGQEYMYISPDGNFVFGGSPAGFDMFVGVRNASSGASSPLSGLYYEIGLDDNAINGLDTYYGAFNAYQGSAIGHERLLFGGSSPYGSTYSVSYPTNISNTYSEASNTTTYTIGQNGFRIGSGNNGYLSIEVGIPYTPPSVTRSVYVDPTGVVNAASSAPYTAGVSPGGFITLYNGVNLAKSTVFAPAGAFPTTLGGVTVTIDGVLQAPLYYVSPTQISFLMPYEVSTFPIASIQVNNNGTTSNITTQNVNLTTPGLFTYNTGIGYGAMLDYPASGGNYFFINGSNPAGPGDTVVAFLAGLGTPFPANGDGALGVVDYLVQTISIDIGGVSTGTPAYAGLAPGLAGLYQINFTVPALCTTSGQTGCLNVGDNSLGISGPDSYSSEALIPIGTGTTASVVTSTNSTPAARKVLPRLTGTPVK